METELSESTMDLPFEHSSRLSELKEKVKTSHAYFKDNMERFDEFMRLVFHTGLTNEDIMKLMALNKPALEFNILEAPVDRLRGEFAAHEPSFKVHPIDGFPAEKITPQLQKQMEFLEGYCRWFLSDSATDGFAYDIFTELLGGGFSVGEIFTDYINEMSFDQKVMIKKCYDSTLTFFDSLARESHKGDGRFCGQLYPKTKEEVISAFGKEAIKDIKFSRSIGDFNWSYKNKDNDIMLICDFYEKKLKKERLVKLSSGDKILKKHYKKLLENWNIKGFIEQPPIIVEERWTEIVTVVRYRFCENKILSYDETNFRYLPLIFFGGNSVNLKGDDNCRVEFTKPYVYHAKGIQRGKNFAGQSVFGNIENISPIQWKVSIEAVPEDYLEAYRKPQIGSVLLYNAFYKGDVNAPLQPPMEVQHMPTPPIVENIFLGADQVSQAILGSYDSVMGTNDKDLSGVTIENASIHTTAAAKPYQMGYIKGLNQVGKILLDLIPKYIVTPRTLPIIKADGKRGFQVVNTPGHPENIDLDYNPDDLNIVIEAGVNSSIRKQQGMDTLIKLNQTMPHIVGEFLGMYGLEIVFDNIEIHNVEALKAKVPEFVEFKKKQAEEASKKGDPQVEIGQAMVKVEAAKVEQRQQESEGKLAIEAAKVAVEKEKVSAQVMEIMSDIENSHAKMAMEHEKIDSENARTAIETAMDLSKHHHEKEMDRAALSKPVAKSKKKETKK